MILPKISIVVPSYGRSEFLDDVLRALFQQDNPPHEIIVVHSGSEPCISEEIRRADKVLFHHHPERLYAGAARNLGAQLASGDVLGFVDADTVPVPNWCSAGIAALTSSASTAAVGSVGYLRSGGYWGFARYLTEFSGVLPKIPSRITHTHGASCSFMVRRDLFQSYDGFDPALAMAEDKTLFFKLRQNHVETFFCHDMLVKHFNVAGFKNNAAHMIHLGFWSWQVEIEHIRTQLIQRLGAIAYVLVLASGIVRFTKILARTLAYHQGGVWRAPLFAPGILLLISLWTWGGLKALNAARGAGMPS